MNSASINLDSLLMCRVHVGWRRHQDKQMQDLRWWLILKVDQLKRENEKAEDKKTKVASKHNEINDKLKKNRGSQPPP